MLGDVLAENPNVMEYKIEDKEIAFSGLSIFPLVHMPLHGASRL